MLNVRKMVPADGEAVAKLEAQIFSDAWSEKSILERANAALQKKAASLQALSPLSTLSRGYAVVYRETEGARQTVFSAESLCVGDEISVRFADGYVSAKAESITLTKKTRKESVVKKDG